VPACASIADAFVLAAKLQLHDASCLVKQGFLARVTPLERRHQRRTLHCRFWQPSNASRLTNVDIG